MRLTPKNSIRTAAIIGIAMMLAAGLQLNAQAVNPVDDTPPPEAKPKTAVPKDDEVIQMSAFTVSTKKTNDYVASETMTGTRLATKVAELPFQVNIITSEFISDFAAYDLSEELGYTSNVSNTPGSGAPIIRGFSTVPYVDGFRRVNGLMPAGVDTDTTNVLKGPMASIYGQTAPGGVVNRGIKHPEDKQQTRVDMAVGSNATFRAKVYTTGPLTSNGKLLYRVSLENDYRKYDQMYAAQHTNYVGGQITWKPVPTFSWNTRISYNLDHDHDRTSLPFIKNSMKDVIAGQSYVYVNGTNSNGSLKYSGTTAAPTSLAVDPYQNSPATIAAYNKWISNGYSTAGLDPQYIYTNPTTGVTSFAAPAQLQRWNKWVGLDYDSANIRSDGMLGETFYRWVEVATSMDKRWSSWFSTKASFDYFDKSYHKQSNSGNQVYDPNPDAPSGSATVYNKTPGRYDNGTIGTQTPQWTSQPYKNIAMQIDNALSFKTGPINHKLLITFDYNELDQTNFTVRYKGGATTTQPTPYPIGSTGNLGADLPIGFIPRGIPLTGADLWYPTYTQYPELYDVANSMANADVLTRDFGMFISERASMFKGRVRGYVGLRYDSITNRMVDQNIAGPADPQPVYWSGTHEQAGTLSRGLNGAGLLKWRTEAWTPQAGLNGNLSENIILFANFSTAYQPTPQVKATRDSNGNYTATLYKNERSYGYEFGVRYSAFNQKLNATLSYFYIDRKNVLNSYTDPETNQTNYDSSGEQDARGVDFDLNWLVTDSLQIIGGWGYNDAKYVTCGLPYLIGTPTPSSVRNNYGLSARYSFKNGALKGISVGGGIKYYEKSMVNPGSGLVYYSGKQANFYNVRMPNGSLPFPNLPEGTHLTVYPQVNVSDGRDQVFNQPYAVCDFWVQYKFRSNFYGSRLNQYVQVNLKNAFDRFYTYGSATVGDGRQVIFTYGFTF